MTSKAPIPMPEGMNRENRPKAPAAPPRKKSDREPEWLILLSKMKACSYCGTVAGPCLSEESCPNDKGVTKDE